MNWQKPKVMGVINVTPDSFSDGGQFLSLENALEQAKLLVSQGAEILDVGGESTRPGAGRISLQEEQARVLPVINAIKKELSVLVSVDTLNSDTAKKAIEAGADIVNDVSGGLADPAMFSSIASTNCLYILGHWRGFSDVMDERAQYSDVAREVVAELAEQVSMAVASGISRDRIIVDPGLGFAKDMQQNWDLVARLDELKKLDLPRRDVATAVLTALLLQRKLWGVRVHNVQATVDAISVVAALKEAENK
jgi:dihydropteroate synthase